MLKKLSKNRGFTLAEIIVSVGIISIMSIYIIKLFLSANMINEESLEMDKSLNYVKNFITLIENEENPYKPQSELLKNFNIIDDKNDFFYEIYLDQDFKLIEENKAIYKMTAMFKEDIHFSFVKHFYNVDVKMDKIINDSSLELIDIKTNLVFNFEKEYLWKWKWKKAVLPF